MASRDSNELPEVFRLIKLRDVCREFIERNEIDTPEMAFIVTHESSEAYDLVKQICNLIGYYGQERQYYDACICFGRILYRTPNGGGKSHL